MSSNEHLNFLRYEDGKLFWIQTTSNKCKVGQEVGTIKTNGYVHVQLFNKKYYAHRIIWTMFNTVIPKGMQVDHINNNRSDNRIENLQLVTNKQNSQRRNNSKGYQVMKNFIRPYWAKKRFNCKSYYCGMFGTPCGAYMANRMFFIRGLHE
tara:strand:+ start:120 stop:572 length:453 start_codon:yes stop_codon:yes gene_type:complete